MAASLGGQNGGEAEKTAFNVSWWWTLGQVEWPIAILTQQRRCGINFTQLWLFFQFYLVIDLNQRKLFKAFRAKILIREPI